MKAIWIVEYEYEGNWCWPWAELGWAFPFRRQALDAAIVRRSKGAIVRVRRFNQAVEVGGKG